MKKKNLQLKLNLSKETVLNLSAKDGVKGGAPGTGGVLLSDDCARTVINCDTQGTVMPCCPGCRSGANATLVKQYCDIVLDTVNKTCAMEPFEPLG